MLAGYKTASALVAAYKKAEQEAFPDNPPGVITESVMRRFHKLNEAYAQLQAVGHNKIFGDK